jgi:cyclic beta-1,2-glucan synthetase
MTYSRTGATSEPNSHRAMPSTRSLGNDSSATLHRGCEGQKEWGHHSGYASDLARDLDVFCERLYNMETTRWRTSAAQSLSHRLKLSDECLRNVKARLTTVLLGDSRLAEPGRWMIENYSFVAAQIDRLSRSIMEMRFERLPTVRDKNGKVVYRIDGFAVQLSDHLRGAIDKPTIIRALNLYQRRHALGIAELWALPDMLALAFIDRLADAADQIFSGSKEPIPIYSAVTSTIDLQCHNDSIVERCINGLRLLERTRWRDVVDATSITESILAKDPSGHYPRMDFTTRNTYRQTLARLSQELFTPEVDVASVALRLAKAKSMDGPGGRKTHVGYYLIDDGVDETREVIAGKWRWPSIYRCRQRGFLTQAYLLAQLMAVVLCATPLLVWGLGQTSSPLANAFEAMLLLFVVSEITIPGINALAAMATKPSLMPRMDYRAKVPDHARTWVVVPCILDSPEQARALIEGIRMRFLANRLANVCYVLLSDLPDADNAVMPGDEFAVRVAAEGIQQLNREYGKDSEPFYLLHRDRKWNETQNRWIGYERKRGKLNALNALLLRGIRRDFSLIVGNIARIGDVRYVITLDSDTQLPWGSARRLIETIDHPLNRPEVTPNGPRIAAGYTIIQPKVSLLPCAGGRTRYAQLFDQFSGLDQYSQVSSDFYHDLFGESPYMGKGIYDVHAFDLLLAARFPENAILSHDLLEGCFARATTASDIEVFEEHPLTFAIDSARCQRWIRGDWQIIRWLAPTVPVFGRSTIANTLSALSRWKLFDNLRRSLFGPALISLLVFSWLTPGLRSTATFVATLPLALPPLSRLGHEIWKRLADAHSAVTHPRFGAALWPHFGRSLLLGACLPYTSCTSLHAIAKTVWRILVSHRNLLEWTTFYTLQRELRLSTDRVSAPLSSPLLTINLIAAGLIASIVQLWHHEHLAAAAPWLCLWALAPILESWSAGSVKSRTKALAKADAIFLRQAARRTWGFFEDHVNATSNWLPPDYVRELPRYTVACKTSPTNIGLALLSTVAAHDFGYIDTTMLLERLGCMLKSIARLRRYQGHLYNWYDTQTLEPLQPMYVSSVDSGNFVAHLLVVRQGLSQLSSSAQSTITILQGLDDTLRVFCEVSSGIDDPLKADLAAKLQVVLRTVEATHGIPANDVGELLNSARSLAPDASIDSRSWATKLHAHCEMIEKHLAYVSAGGGCDDWHKLVVDQLIRLCDQLTECTFRLFYDEEREFLHIGFNPINGRCDAGHYDMLASEARLATYVGVARNELPPEAWFALGRLQTCKLGTPTLLSWSGSMFEYLMPNLVMPNVPGTLIDASLRGAVIRHIAYARRSGVPWGISESAYAEFDCCENYCYRAFGVPTLGLQPNVERRLVIAPYASALALLVHPHAATRNLKLLAEAQMLTTYGFYEAIDYTNGFRGTNAIGPQRIRQHMAHHQGMSLLAFCFATVGNSMQERFRGDAQLRAATILLKERAPQRSEFVSPEQIEITDSDTQLLVPAEEERAAL